MPRIKKEPKQEEQETIFLEQRETMVIFYDYHNISAGFRALSKELDLCALRDYLSEGRKSVENIVYIGTNPLDMENSNKRIVQLLQAGFLVKTKLAKVLPDKSLKCNFDIEIVLDAIDIAEKVRPSIMVLASGDGDFLPLIERLRYLGIRTEIASLDGIISKELKCSANGYIDLTEVELIKTNGGN